MSSELEIAAQAAVIATLLKVRDRVSKTAVCSSDDEYLEEAFELIDDALTLLKKRLGKET